MVSCRNGGKTKREKIEKMPGRLILTPTSLELDAYAGFYVSEYEDCYRVAFLCAEGGGKVDPASFVVEPALNVVLEPFSRALTARVQEASDVPSFKAEFLELADQAIAASVPDGEQPIVPAAFYEMLLTELEQLGWHRLVDLDAERRIIILKAIDTGKRIHELTLTLPPDYPNSPPHCVTDLPVPFQPSRRSALRARTADEREKKRFRSGLDDNNNFDDSFRDVGGSDAAFALVSIVDQWESKLAACQAFWEQLDDLDDNTWILEPERIPVKGHTPSEAASSSSSTSSTTWPKDGVHFDKSFARPPRYATHRRVAVAPHASILIEHLDPAAPYAVPTSVRFLGKDSIVAPLRARFSRTLQQTWDTSGKSTLRQNLENILGCTLPCPSDSKKSSSPSAATTTAETGDDRFGFTADCAICYSYRLTEQTANFASSSSSTDSSGKQSIPDVVCSNTRCSRSFHRSCLSEWLRGLPNASRSFETLFGHCPYCFEPISVNVNAR